MNFDINNIDFNNLGSLPLPIKAIFILVICVAVIGLGFYFDTRTQLTVLEGVQAQETELKSTFESTQRQASSLLPLKKQLAEIEDAIGDQLKLLPSKTEIEALLVDISQAGLAAGLEFRLFKPQPEQKTEFIATLPIQISVTGTYHEMGEFISAVAALPRIVTQHNVVISPVVVNVTEGDPLRLAMSIVAQTYRYLEEEEGEGAGS